MWYTIISWCDPIKRRALFTQGLDKDTNLERWRPLLELHLPVEHDGGGDDDEVRAPNVFFTGEMAEERNRLMEKENFFEFEYFVKNINLRT